MRSSLILESRNHDILRSRDHGITIAFSFKYKLCQICKDINIALFVN